MVISFSNDVLWLRRWLGKTLTNVNLKISEKKEKSQKVIHTPKHTYLSVHSIKSRSPDS